MCIDLFSIGGFTVHGYGLMIGLGFVAAIYLGCFLAKKVGLSADFFTSVAIRVLIFGFMGGKLLFVIVNFSLFLSDPLGALGSEGFVVYGGIITGILTIFVSCKLKKVSFIEYMDMMSPAVLVNQGFGRIGCFMAGCCHGRETDSWIGVVFPEGCLAPAGVKLLPTQLFSAGFDLLLAGILVYVLLKKKKTGMVSGLYLMCYGVGRFIIEIFRGDLDRGTVGVLSTSQFISIFMVIFAAGYIYYVNKHATRSTDSIR